MCVIFPEGHRDDVEYQEEMQRLKGRSNAQTLFGMKDIPSDSHIRSLLDPVSPNHLGAMYRLVFERLEAAGLLDVFRSHARSLLIALDGTEYFSSPNIHCLNCSHRQLANGKTNYYHSVLTPVIVQAGNEHMISLEPEFITPQDGHEKQDCEIEAGKRWLCTCQPPICLFCSLHIFAYSPTVLFDILHTFAIARFDNFISCCSDAAGLGSRGGRIHHRISLVWTIKSSEALHRTPHLQ